MTNYRHVLLDIEGTIVLDKKYTPIPRSVKWFNSLPQKGIWARLVTNNTTESPDDLYRILSDKGYRFKKDDYFTCLTEALVRMKRVGVKSCYVLGNGRVKKYLAGNGITPLNSAHVDAVLVGLDPALTYHKLNLSVEAIWKNGARLFTLHRNRRYMNEKREVALSSGPIAAALENACLVRAIVCGKPDKRFFLDSIKGWDISRSKILMVSDDPFADLIGAKKLGMSTCWVLTGSVTKRSAIEKIPLEFRPDLICHSVIDIPL
jgi:HAD superfamily hydrolase (TIGR01450 family)